MDEFIGSGLVSHVGDKYSFLELHRLLVEYIDIAFSTHEYGHVILLVLPRRTVQRPLFSRRLLMRGKRDVHNDIAALQVGFTDMHLPLGVPLVRRPEQNIAVPAVDPGVMGGMGLFHADGDPAEVFHLDRILGVTGIYGNVCLGKMPAHTSDINSGSILPLRGDGYRRLGINDGECKISCADKRAYHHDSDYFSLHGFLPFSLLTTMELLILQNKKNDFHPLSFEFMQ